MTGSKLTALVCLLTATPLLAGENMFSQPLLVPPGLSYSQSTPYPMSSQPVYSQPSYGQPTEPVLIPQPMDMDNYYVPGAPSTTIYSSPIITQPAPLFRDVRYRQERNIHPLAVSTIVEAPNPCYDCKNPYSPKCVCIEVCMPPCGQPCIEVKRNGDKLTYDFGKYAVNVIVRRDHLVVNYDD